jgi:hypothetical protein
MGAMIISGCVRISVAFALMTWEASSRLPGHASVPRHCAA